VKAVHWEELSGMMPKSAWIAVLASVAVLNVRTFLRCVPNVMQATKFLQMKPSVEKIATIAMEKIVPQTKMTQQWSALMEYAGLWNLLSMEQTVITVDVNDRMIHVHQCMRMENAMTSTVKKIRPARGVAKVTNAMLIIMQQSNLFHR
jgi:hypothetical protein